MSSQAYIFNPTERTSAAAGDGFSAPRLTTTDRNALSLGTNGKGMMVYDTTLTTLCIWNGTAWEFVTDNSNGVYSVKDFGAKGDGVTDDTVAFQTALDFVMGIHGQLFVPIGNYLISSTLYIDKSQFLLMGEGPVSTGAGISRGLTGDATQGAVLIYTGVTCALQVSNSRLANPLLAPSNPGFINEILIQNIRIEVPAACAVALRVFQPSNGYFFNIALWGNQSTGGVPNGSTLLMVNAGINNIFEKVDCLGIGRYTTAVPNYQYYANYGAQLLLGWSNDLATTTIFRKCYFHYCNIGVNLSYLYNFEDCIFEATRIGVNCLADIRAHFNRCWWEANVDLDVTFNNSEVIIENSRLNAYSRQKFFSTGGGVKGLTFNNVYFSTTNANPFIFGSNPSGENIFKPATTYAQEIIFNSCIFPVNTKIGYIYNSNNINQIQIGTMEQTSYSYKALLAAASVAAFTTESGFSSVTMPRDGHIVGLSFYTQGAVTAGTVDFAVSKNGVVIPAVSYPAQGFQSAFPFSIGIQPFDAKVTKGDVITVYFHSDALWAPAQNVCFELIIAFGPSGEVA